MISGAKIQRKSERNKKKRKNFVFSWYNIATNRTESQRLRAKKMPRCQLQNSGANASTLSCSVPVLPYRNPRGYLYLRGIVPLRLSFRAHLTVQLLNLFITARDVFKLLKDGGIRFCIDLLSGDVEILFHRCRGARI